MFDEPWGLRPWTSMAQRGSFLGASSGCLTLVVTLTQVTSVFLLWSQAMAHDVDFVDVSVLSPMAAGSAGVFCSSQEWSLCSFYFVFLTYRFVSLICWTYRRIRSTVSLCFLTFNFLSFNSCVSFPSSYLTRRSLPFFLFSVCFLFFCHKPLCPVCASPLEFLWIHSNVIHVLSIHWFI